METVVNPAAQRAGVRLSTEGREILDFSIEECGRKTPDDLCRAIERLLFRILAKSILASSAVGTLSGFRLVDFLVVG